MRLGIFGLQIHGSLKACHCFVESALLFQKSPQKVVGLGMPRRKPHQLLQMRYRLARIAERVARGAEKERASRLSGFRLEARR